ncbi:MAG: 4Fe-4S binding protein, partial [Rhodospirillales bacterium]|nr:4Fe-4S binding protein [Rhodospirillales bacterium]
MVLPSSASSRLASGLISTALALRGHTTAYSLLFRPAIGSPPASLHPVINPTICIGCTACADACPEQNVLGVINGKAALISPSNCIGHGACRVACPVDAIELTPCYDLVGRTREEMILDKEELLAIHDETKDSKPRKNP